MTDRDRRQMVAATVWHIETSLNLIDAVSDDELREAIEHDQAKGFDLGIVLMKAIEFVQRCERLELP